jgi:hypothetical protein|nr:MAG TPA: hypothetical protein [Caudoviricetes sp.]
MGNKDNSIQYSVNDKTVRCIDLLKEIVAIQEKTLAYFVSEGIEDSKEAETFAESIGNAVKAFGGVLPEGIYNNVVGIEV